MQKFEEKIRQAVRKKPPACICVMPTVLRWFLFWTNSTGRLTMKSFILL